MGRFGPTTGRWLWLGVIVACDGSHATSLPEGGPPTVSPECASDQACSAGQRCLTGRCTSRCSDDRNCSSRERCSSEGASAGLCVSRMQELPADPCAGVLCPQAAPVCHPLSGECVACGIAEDCPEAAPVCDIARGSCGPRESLLCAPCNGSDDCNGGDPKASVSFGCVALDEAHERVCVVLGCTSDADCPATYECLRAKKACFPRRGSCTSYRAAERATSCVRDEDCSPRGLASDSVYRGICHDGACAYGCVATPDCPGSLICTPPVCVPANQSDAGPTKPADGGV